jgi:hypothetical protein
MSKARLVSTAVITKGRSQHELARAYGIHQSWVSRLVARYRAEGEAAFQPRSRRPDQPDGDPASNHHADHPTARGAHHRGPGRRVGYHPWHLAHHHSTGVSAATISRYLTRLGLVTPQPTKRPKASWKRFQAELPNQCWQADSPTTRSPAPATNPPVTPRS